MALVREEELLTAVSFSRRIEVACCVAEQKDFLPHSSMPPA